MPSEFLDRTSRRLDWRIIVLCALLGVHMFVFEAGVGGADGWSFLANLDSLMSDGDLDLANNMIDFPRDYPAQPYMYSRATHRWVTHEPLGVSFFQAPFFLVFSAASRAFQPEFGLDKIPYSELDAATMMKVLSMVVANNFWALCAIVLVYATLRKLDIGARPAFWTCLFAFFGGPLHWYSTTGLSHAASCFCLAFILYLFVGSEYSQGGSRLVRIFFLGASIGVSSAVRYANGLMIFAFVLFYLFTGFKDVRNLIKSEATLVAGCCTTAWITFVYWKSQFGGYFSNPHAEAQQFMLTLVPPPLFKVLLSPVRGFFIFNPVFLLAVVGIVFAIVHRKRLQQQLFRVMMVGAVGFCFIALLYDSYEEWHGAGAFSSRYLTGGVILLSPALAYFLQGKSIRPLRYVLAGLGTLFSYGLFLLSRARLIDLRGDPFSVGWSITDYAYVFKEGVPISRCISGVLNSSYTLRFLAARPPLLIIAVGLVIVFCAGLLYVLATRGERAKA